MKHIHLSALATLVLTIPYVMIAWAGGPDSFRRTQEGHGLGGPPPTLQETVESAYNRHPQRQALDARVQETVALTLRSGSLIAGSPALEAGYKTDQVGSGDGFREWEAGLSLPLWQLGQRDAEQVVAQRAADASNASQRALRITVAGEVRERMWEAALMQNNLELAKKEWDTALALESNVRRRVELGELAKTDLLLARDTTLTKRAAYLRAQVESDNARRRYESYTGMSRLPRRRGEPRTELNAIPDDHARLAEAVTVVREAQAQAIAVRRSRGGAPELFVGGSGERADADSDFNNRLGLSLTVPIGSKTHTAPGFAAAERVRAEAQANYDRIKRNLILSLEQAARELESADSELQLATEQRTLAQENLRLAQVAFEVGETDLIGLLRVQSLAFAAERRERELHITRQRAIARYNQAVGVLP